LSGYIKPEIEARVLTSCARRCCLCFHLKRSALESEGATNGAYGFAEKPGMARHATYTPKSTGMLVLNNGWQFLPKPFMADMLRDRVRDFLSEQPPMKAHLEVSG
jgi:hypothetical protein